MTVDLDAIAQRGRCEVSSLRLALPLIEQGYKPPFLSRYRRDELGDIDEASLWTLAHAVRSENDLSQYREELQSAWQQTPLADPAIGRAIGNSHSKRLLDRLSRRVKLESGEAASLSQRLAVRVLNPQKGDGEDLTQLAQSMLAESQAEPAAEGETAAATEVPANDDVESALAKLDHSIAKRLTGDPRIISAAVRWLSRHAKIHVSEVHDPHINAETGGDDESEESDGADESSDAGNASGAAKPSETAKPPETAKETEAAKEAEVSEEVVPPTSEETTLTEEPATTPVAEATPAETPAAEVPAAEVPAAETPATDPPATEASVAETPTADAATSPVDAEAVDAEASAPENTEVAVSTDAPVAESTPAAQPPQPTKAKPKAKAKAKPKKTKKISPRQRRRRWLVSTLKPLAGKRMPANKLSSFQLVMLGRALRSQVAQCAFDYDAAKLVAELQKTAGAFNRPLAERLADLVLQNEAVIRDAAEAAWWDELQEQASARLVSIAADNLHSQINRGGVQAKVVMSIDAVGPRTAATSIVSSDGRLLHSEDIPCQLSAAMRTLAVNKMGELVHAHHVDLIVISNGPARRACMIAVSELIKQSAEKSVRWTLADRSGADAYAGGPAGDQEMKSTPRRFRAAAWIAFSALQPAQALVKVDPLKLRLGSFQRELSDDAILAALEDVMVSGAARGGVDVNSTTTTWMQRLPGVTKDVATAIETRRRESLIASREDLATAVQWPSLAHSRQAMPFLRVFGSTETLDGTLIHPDDYPLAKKLAAALKIELPPDRPPAYELPDYSEPEPTPVTAEAAPANSASAESDASEATADEATEASDFASSLSESKPVEADGAEPTETPETTDAVAAEEAATEPGATEPVASEEPTTEEPTTEEPATEEAAAEATSNAESTESAAEAEATTETAPVDTDVIRRPMPERAAVDKLIKEWQIGNRRSHQLVRWLCDPFGEGEHEGEAPAVMTSMPSLSELKPGDQVVGVVVGVMPFGVFIELSPDCSGLIHVSRISDGFIEDLHEAVQVGDVVSAWVTGTDAKRRRVALSAISPEREAAMEARRQNERGSRGPGGRGPGSKGPGGQRGGQAGGSTAGQGQRSGGQGQQRGGQTAGAATGGGEGQRGQGQRGQGQGQRGGKPGGGKPGGGRPGGREGGRGGRPGGGGRDSRSRGPKKPEVYEVIGKDLDKPKISEAMVKGDEPLRSFGDLMQMFSKEKGQTSPPKAVAPKPEPAKPEPAKPEPAKPEPAPAEPAPAEANSVEPAAKAPVVDAPANEAPATEGEG